MNKILVEALDSYNELNAVMNLVLFEDAMMHVCRINRILESPRGNALLIGVGGSGKQSLSRLAASISSLEVFQITLRKGYSIADLKLDISQLYIKAGLKNMGMVFLMTDAQVADEKFLVLINDLLASGEIPDLFPDDEVENVINGVRNEVKGLGMEDSRENCWRFFIDKVRRSLKVRHSCMVGFIVDSGQIGFSNSMSKWKEHFVRNTSKRFLNVIHGVFLLFKLHTALISLHFYLAIFTEGCICKVKTVMGIPLLDMEKNPE